MDRLHELYNGLVYILSGHENRTQEGPCHPRLLTHQEHPTDAGSDYEAGHRSLISQSPIKP